LSNRICAASHHIELGVFLYGSLQLFLTLTLSFGEYILRNWFTRLWISSGGVPSLPATVLSFADVALSVCSFSWHLATSFATQTHTTSLRRKLVLWRKFYQINKSFLFVYCGANFEMFCSTAYLGTPERTPNIFSEILAIFVVTTPFTEFFVFWNALSECQNCPHCGQKWSA
jgi:hypothetical protein